MKPITYIDRQTEKKLTEKVYGANALKFLYSGSVTSQFLLNIIAKNPCFSKLYGWIQTLKITKGKIVPFIKKYDVDVSEFEKNPEEFSSFNDFFIRKLKPTARPITNDADCIIPTDGRYRFFPNITNDIAFDVKGKMLQLDQLIANAKEYKGGTMVMGRLCPSDYHRFHFPCDGIPSKSTLVNGWLYSVNPIALKRNFNFLAENKRMACEIETQFGTILYIEVGATCVGTVHQTYQPGKKVLKGAEKGFFSFGGSTVLLLFKHNQITLSSDLLQWKNQEIRCLMGQPLGKFINS